LLSVRSPSTAAGLHLRVAVIELQEAIAGLGLLVIDGEHALDLAGAARSHAGHVGLDLHISVFCFPIRDR